MFRISVTAILGGIEMLTWHTTVGSDGTRGSKCWTVDAEQKKNNIAQ